MIEELKVIAGYHFTIIPLFNITGRGRDAGGNKTGKWPGDDYPDNKCNYKRYTEKP